MGAVMDRAVILGEGRKLEIAQALGLVPVVEVRPVKPEPGASTPGTSGFATLDQAMAAHIRAALARCGGRVEGDRGAAALLGINPHTLRARMRKLGIDWAAYRASPGG
jgi:DNA-binding NtrC family response regulator